MAQGFNFLWSPFIFSPKKSIALVPMPNSNMMLSADMLMVSQRTAPPQATENKAGNTKWEISDIQILESYIKSYIQHCRFLLVCLCIWASVCPCAGLLVYLSASLRPFFQITAFMVPAQWRGHDNQLAHTKLIQPSVCVSVCMFPNECSCFIGKSLLTYFNK